MNRPKLLIIACTLAAVSLGGNFWLLSRRNESPPPAPEKPAVELPKTADFDFTGTGLSDDAWKLSDDAKPGVKLDQPFELGIKDPAAPAPK